MLHYIIIMFFGLSGLLFIIIFKRHSGINPIPPTVIDRDYKET